MLEKLKDVPFYYQFDNKEGRLLNWSEYLSQLNKIKTVYCINKMRWLATKKYKNKQNRDVCKKYNIDIKFNKCE